MSGCSGEKGMSNWTCFQLKADFSEEHLTSCQPQSQQMLKGKKATQQQKFKVKHPVPGGFHEALTHRIFLNLILSITKRRTGISAVEDTFIWPNSSESFLTRRILR